MKQFNVPNIYRSSLLSAVKNARKKQDKLKKEGVDSLISMPQHNTVKDEALSALVMLGFAKQTAEKTIDQILKVTEGTLSVEQLIKHALKNL